MAKNDLQRGVRLKELCYVDKARYCSPPRAMGLSRRAQPLEVAMKPSASFLVVNQRQKNW